jgi:dTDP-4-dehydrorhamnose reductase
MSKKRLLVIGAGGFLGRYAVRAAEACGGFQVIRAGRALSETRSAEPNGGEKDMESAIEAVEVQISDAASVDCAIDRVMPNSVLMLAAMSDIDRCERSPQEAFAANVRGAENVANSCARAHARLLFTSSAAVFDGSRQSYHEEDPPNPLSVYGETKLQAEKIIREKVPSAVILRFALALGFALGEGTNAMLDSLMARWRVGAAVEFSTEEDRNPIDAATLGQIMVALIGDPGLSGVYHAGASDSVSRYELGRRLAARAGVSADLVRPQQEAVPGRAPRGRHHFLLSHKLAQACDVKAPSTDEVIERCFA